MRLIFLGTGGGRFVMAKQIRKTAGFLIRGEETLIHIDPGPGAIVYINKLGVDPERLSAVVVTHNHLDHSSDAAVLVEAMTHGGKRKRGVFIGSKCAIEGGENFIPALSPYHKGMVERCIKAVPGMETVIGDIHFLFTETRHDEPTGIGFIAGDEKAKIAYLSDTGYIDDVAHILEENKPDAVIFNLIFDSNADIPHTTTGAVRKYLTDYTPPLVLLQHFGARILLKKATNAIAKRIEREFGTEVIALNDGDVIDIPKRKRGLELYMRGEHEA